jgi:hypothetical protein
MAAVFGAACTVLEDCGSHQHSTVLQAAGQQIVAAAAAAETSALKVKGHSAAPAIYSVSDPVAMLPWLVLLGRALLQCGSQLQLLHADCEQADEPAAGTAAAAAAAGAAAAAVPGTVKRVGTPEVLQCFQHFMWLDSSLPGAMVQCIAA